MRYQLDPEAEENLKKLRKELKKPDDKFDAYDAMLYLHTVSNKKFTEIVEVIIENYPDLIQAKLQVKAVEKPVEKIVYVDKPVTRVVEKIIEKPVEKVVYVEKDNPTTLKDNDKTWRYALLFVILVAAYIIYNLENTHKARYNRLSSSIAFHLQELKKQSQSLQFAIEEFNHENWRGVVPNVKIEAEKLDETIQHAENNVYNQ